MYVRGAIAGGGGVADGGRAAAWWGEEEEKGAREFVAKGAGRIWNAASDAKIFDSA